MTDTESLEDQISALRAQITSLNDQVAPLTEKLRQLKEVERQTAVARIAEIREQVKKLVDEAEQLTNQTGIPFYRSTFLDGIDSGYDRYDGSPYWESSEYC
jgi:predicted  nucleic acid-binding Zn-ribbon protein